MLKIISISPSPVKNKRFRIFLNNGMHYDFGLLNPVSGTYIDHHDKQKRFSYWARHIKNHNEQKLIDDLIPSPALFSATLLWGKSTDLNTNINYLNNEWRKWNKSY